jgi:N-methylhydantoinase A
VDLAEVGAGGGSVLRVDAGGVLQVGPESAGADPGPVCYGQGGLKPTLTDANLVLGYLNPEGLAGGTLRLDLEAARKCIQETVANPMGLSVEEAALGAHRIAGARMVRAVRAVSAERGYDPRRFTLLASGGSGPLHAVGMAQELGIPQVLIPGSPGVFSAFGLLGAGMQYDRARTVLTPVDDLVPETVVRLFEEMATEARKMMPDAELSRSADLRYVSQSYELSVSIPEGAPDLGAHLREGFEAAHERMYGHRAENDPVEVVTFRLQASLPAPELPAQAPVKAEGEGGFRTAYFGSGVGWMEVPALFRNNLPTGSAAGPFIVEDYDATTLIPPDVRAHLDRWSNVVIAI